VTAGRDGMIRAVAVPGDDILRRLPLFRRLGGDDRSRIAASSRLVRYPRGTRVFGEGDPADAFLAIVEGRV
jgi:CRP-like cAMP-binding protein